MAADGSTRLKVVPRLLCAYGLPSNYKRVKWAYRTTRRQVLSSALAATISSASFGVDYAHAAKNSSLAYILQERAPFRVSGSN